jgi:hypothetical protein
VPSVRVKGVTKREIARVLKLSRLSVRKVLRSNSTNVPEIQRAEKAEPYRQQILDLLVSCKGNLVRVHEELTAGGAALSYPALTNRVLPQARHRTNPDRARGTVSLRAGRGDAARYVSAPSRSGRQEVQGADRWPGGEDQWCPYPLTSRTMLLRLWSGVVLFAHAVFPDQSHVPEIRLQGVSHRCTALHGRRSRTRDDR